MCSFLGSELCFVPEAQPQTPVKDKSPWRKSNLNVPNSAEETELDMRRLRRIRSRGNMDAGSASSNPLQVFIYNGVLSLRCNCCKISVMTKIVEAVLLQKFVRHVACMGETRNITQNHLFRKLSGRDYL